VSLGDLDAALADVQRALELLSVTAPTAEQHAAVLDTRGWVYLALGRPAEARADFHEAIASTPNVQPTSPLGRGVAAVQLGDEMSGVLDLKWGLLIAPSARQDPEVRDLVVQAHATLRGIMPAEIADRFEPDDSPQDAKPLPLDDQLQLHSIHHGGDVDWVSFDLDAGDIIRVYTVSPECDTYLTLYAPDGRTALREDDDGGFYRDSELQFRVQADGTYYAQVRSFFADEGTCASYQLGANVEVP
jgi:hypothetical protein